MGFQDILKNKRGGFGDVIFWMVAIFVIGIVFLVMWKVMKIMDDEFQANPTISSEGKAITSKLRDRYIGVTDSAFSFLFFGLALAIVIGAFFIRSHPALFWVSIPIMAFIIFLGAIFTNFFDNFSKSGQFVNEISDFTVMSFVLNNFITVLVGVVLLVAVALFAKNSLNTQ